MIGIIFVGDIKFCPYLKKYTDILEKKHIKYEVIFWNRDGEYDEKFENDIYYIFKKQSILRQAPYKKIKDFIEFGKFSSRRIKEKNYQGLIFLSTLSAVFLSPYILKKYKDRYIFDYRDLSYEHLLGFNLYLTYIIKNSYFTCISSKGFKKVLPKKYDYVTCHNLQYSDVENLKILKEKKVEFIQNKRPIVVSYLGFIRGYEHITKIIDKFGKDNRFILNYHGTGTDYIRIREYCLEKKYLNVFCTGYYDSSNKLKLMLETDILNNHYSINKNIKLATSNKLYDGIIYKRPQLVNKGSFDEKNIEMYGVGWSLDINDDEFTDKLYKAYMELDKDQFYKNCTNALKNIIEEDQVYLKTIDSFLYKITSKEENNEKKDSNCY